MVFFSPTPELHQTQGATENHDKIGMQVSIMRHVKQMTVKKTGILTHFMTQVSGVAMMHCSVKLR